MCLNIPKTVYLKQHLVQACVYKHSVFVFGSERERVCLGQLGWRGNGDTLREKGRKGFRLWPSERLRDTETKREGEPGNWRGEPGSGCVQQRVCQRAKESEGEGLRRWAE